MYITYEKNKILKSSKYKDPCLSQGVGLEDPQGPSSSIIQWFLASIPQE